MVDQHLFRSTALALPEAYEDLHRGRPAFRVAKRIFATLGVAGNTALFRSLDRASMAVVKLADHRQSDLGHLTCGAVRPTEVYGHHGWTYVDLDRIDAAALSLILELAWDEVAPRSLKSAAIPTPGAGEF